MKIPNLSQDPSGQTYLIQMGLRAVGYDIAADNWMGPKTEAALKLFQQSLEGEGGGIWSKVRASSFADPRDVANFNRCKASGKTDNQCFSEGDNGIGKWKHITAQTTHPMAALPREIWRDAGKTGGAKLQVKRNGIIVEGILGDTMPALSNIKNGAGIDLNPAFAKQLGLTPPFLADVEWRWI